MHFTRMPRSQSAMEYLMTYGWTILVIMVVIAALFALGVFNGPSSGGASACVAQSGYQCTRVTLSTTGTLGATVGQIGLGSVTIGAVGCGTTAAEPAMNTISPVTLSSGQTASLNFSSCFSGTEALGTKFSGYLWIEYNTPGSSNTYAVVAKVQTTVSSVSQQGGGSGQYNGNYFAPITISNNQNSGTGSNFQQIITFSTSTYTSNEASDLGNIRFYQGGNQLYSWCESGCSNSGTTAVFWVLIPSGLGAAGSGNIIVANMVFLPTSTEYDGLYAGEAPQLSSTFGQYDNIAHVMNGGLQFQIYFDSSGTCDSTFYQSNLYTAKLGSSITISGCASFVSSTSPFTTSGSGSTQSVNGNSKSYVVMNYQSGDSGGAAYPNPPVSNTGNSWLIKAVGWADFSSSTSFSVLSDDNIALGLSTTGGDASGSAWLGGGSNPNNLVSGWVVQGPTQYNSGSTSAGAYRVELDYSEDGGGFTPHFGQAAARTITARPIRRAG